eukprot:TRINITY_DN36093_c0_g1_i1.p1 TRINITY_DN36093_c0_g1~~TRINITY_DN36093_c0_g1_i1.p1  ORF type:complete len:778 (-),score=140.78 TRINITY_DN36093_c0_g1_i1:67-2400(-)
MTLYMTIVQLIAAAALLSGSVLAASFPRHAREKQATQPAVMRSEKSEKSHVAVAEDGNVHGWGSDSDDTPSSNSVLLQPGAGLSVDDEHHQLTRAAASSSPSSNNSDAVDDVVVPGDDDSISGRPSLFVNGSLCVGTDGTESIPNGFMLPDNYPTTVATTEEKLWKWNKQGLYGIPVMGAKYAAVTLAKHQPNGGYYVIVFGDAVVEGNGTNVDLPMSDCDFAAKNTSAMKLGARPDSQARQANDGTSWSGTTWRVYTNPAPRTAPRDEDMSTIFPKIEFPSLDAEPTAEPDHPLFPDKTPTKEADPQPSVVGGVAGADSSVSEASGILRVSVKLECMDDLEKFKEKAIAAVTEAGLPEDSQPLRVIMTDSSDTSTEFSPTQEPNWNNVKFPVDIVGEFEGLPTANASSADAGSTMGQPEIGLHHITRLQDTLEKLLDAVQNLKAEAGSSAATSQYKEVLKPAEIRTQKAPDEEIVHLRDMYLANRLKPRGDAFETEGDGTRSMHTSGLKLRMDPGSSPRPDNGNNTADIDLQGYACTKFYGTIRPRTSNPEDLAGMLFSVSQLGEDLGAATIDGTSGEYVFDFDLAPCTPSLTISVLDNGKPEQNTIEVEGYFHCQVDCTARALDTDDGSCESLLAAADEVRCQGAADPDGRPCQWTGDSCVRISSGTCHRGTLCADVTAGSTACESRKTYDECAPSTDQHGKLCGWKDVDQVCFTSNFDCKLEGASLREEYASSYKCKNTPDETPVTSDVGTTDNTSMEEQQEAATDSALEEQEQ